MQKLDGYTDAVHGLWRSLRKRWRRVGLGSEAFAATVGLAWLLCLDSVSQAASLPSITADSNGSWVQNAQNADQATVDQICVTPDGNPSQILGCSATTVAPGAAVGIPAMMSPGLAVQNVRAVALRSGIASAPSIDARPVNRGQAPPAGVITLAIVGNPSSGPWGVSGAISDTRDTMVDVFRNGILHHHENTAPYGFPDDGQTGTFGAGQHVIEFRFFLQDTTTELGRKSITVTEGAPLLPKCGDGLLNGTEVCDGNLGCTAPSTCNQTCTACSAPAPPQTSRWCQVQPAILSCELIDGSLKCTKTWTQIPCQ